MSIYEKICCDESKKRAKAYSELCDIVDRQIREFERLQRLDSSLFPTIVAELLRDRKLTQAQDVMRQIDCHLRSCFL